MRIVMALVLTLLVSSCSLFGGGSKPDPAPTATSGNPGWVPAECNPSPECPADQCMCVQDSTCHHADKCHKRP